LQWFNELVNILIDSESVLKVIIKLLRLGQLDLNAVETSLLVGQSIFPYDHHLIVSFQAACKQDRMKTATIELAITWLIRASQETAESLKARGVDTVSVTMVFLAQCGLPLLAEHGFADGMTVGSAPLPCHNTSIWVAT
jgi:hypothetical protein